MGISMNMIDSQLDNDTDIPVKIIICPRYPGCRIYLYKPVSISLWASTVATEYVKYFFNVIIECILITKPITTQTAPAAKNQSQAYTLPIVVAPIENDKI